MKEGRFQLANLEEMVERNIQNYQPPGLEKGCRKKIDWSGVDYHIQQTPVYKLSEDNVKGTMSSRKVYFRNDTSVEQSFKLSETIVTSNSYSFGVHGGIVSNFLTLGTTDELQQHGLPSRLSLRANDMSGSQRMEKKVACPVQVPAMTCMSANITGNEVRMKGTFEQKVRVTGEIVVIYYNEERVVKDIKPIPIDSLFHRSRTTDDSGTGIYFGADGAMETTMRGTCNFQLATNTDVTIAEEQFYE